MFELVNELKRYSTVVSYGRSKRNYKFSVVKITPVDANDKPIDHYILRKIKEVTDEGFVSFSNLIKDKLDIFRRFPTDENRRDIPNGYVEKLKDKYGNNLYMKIEFLTEFPKFNRV